MTALTSVLVEDYVPVVKYNGFNSNQSITLGGSANLDMSASSGTFSPPTGGIAGTNTTGATLAVTNTGVYTGTGLVPITANSATTGTIVKVSGTALTTGTALALVAAAATLTTGFYVRCNDGALDVLTVGANGHVTSNQTTAPTIVVTTQAGISAAAIAAGSTDVCGTITTTGTSTGATQLTVTFNKTYTVAPKTVCLTPANAAAAMPNTGYFVDAITATTFRITVAAGGTYAATPSWYYQVIA